MAIGDRILLADADGGRISSLSDEDPEFARELEAGSRPGGRKRRKPKPPRLTEPKGDGPPDLVVAAIERSERSRVLVTLGAWQGKLRCQVRAWRRGIRGSDEWRPTYQGVTIGLDELNAIIAGLQEARRIISEKRPAAPADAD